MTTNSMFADKAIGFLLFSGMIVLTVSRQSGIFRRFNSIRNIYAQKEVEGPNGDFVLRKARRNRLWRDFVSENGGECDSRCEIEVKNETGEILLFCWIMPSGKLRNFTVIHDGSIKDNSCSNCHVEEAHINHAFVCIRKSKRSPKTLTEVSDEDFVFVYRPTLQNFRHKISLTKNKRDEFQARIICKKTNDERGKNNVTDTSNKFYGKRDLCGFTCNFEPGVFEKTNGLQEALTEDLEALCCLLPEKALKLLQKSTPLWINISIKFGPVDSRIDESMCFHPSDGQDWLTSMGMRADKAGGIEMYSAKHYLDYRDQWGVGGVMLHEFCHAYHYKHCKDGFDNEHIKEAYETAMEKKLYDCVPVHGPQGLKGGCKAYACYNCMEFFAELSVAFHWQKDALKGDVPYTCDIEYNKWYPHNFMQLKSHDIDTCKILAKMWQVNLDTIPGQCAIRSDQYGTLKQQNSSKLEKIGKIIDDLVDFRDSMDVITSGCEDRVNAH